MGGDDKKNVSKTFHAVKEIHNTNVIQITRRLSSRSEKIRRPRKALAS